jgi:ubiquinone biosynthesis monooxygenase Coq6
MGAWKHLHEDRIKGYNDMQVWDAISDARVKFNTSMLEVGLQDQPIAWMIENVHLQNGVLQSVQEHRSTGANIEILEKTKVEKIFYEPVDTEDPQQMDLSDWPAIALSNGRTIKTRLLVI